MSLCRRIHEGRSFWVDCMTQRIAGPDDACDLYVYEDDAGWVCDRCLLGPNVEREWRYPSVYIRTDLELLAHLHRHRQAGHRFPGFMESFVEEEMR